MNKSLRFLPVIVFIGLILFFAISLTKDPKGFSSQIVNRDMPSFDLPAIEGFSQGLKTADFGGDIVLLNVFGSWCAACRQEHPFLMQLQQNNILPIYGLNWKDEPGAGTAWLERYGNPYTLIGDDQNSRVAIDLGVTGAPETYIVDQQARIRYKHIGPLTPEIWQDIFVPLIATLKNEEDEQ